MFWFYFVTNDCQHSNRLDQRFVKSRKHGIITDVVLPDKSVNKPNPNGQKPICYNASYNWCAQGQFQKARTMIKSKQSELIEPHCQRHLESWMQRLATKLSGNWIGRNIGSLRFSLIGDKWIHIITSNKISMLNMTWRLAIWHIKEVPMQS